MRLKEQILRDARSDITNEHYIDQAHDWLHVRQIEVLIDIRDILAADMKTAIADIVDQDL